MQFVQFICVNHLSHPLFFRLSLRHSSQLDKRFLCHVLLDIFASACRLACKLIVFHLIAARSVP